MDGAADRDIQRAIEIGHSNERMILLAQAWCRHIRHSRGVMGVGMVEQMTGLPISGGTFRCDHATSGTSVQGMDLEVIALDFYRKNCQSCDKRDPTIDLDNLGSWAEGILAAELAAVAKRERIAEAEKDASASRARERRAITGARDAETQSILDLLDQVDRPSRDFEARHKLLEHASLHPEAFSKELVGLGVGPLSLTP